MKKKTQEQIILQHMQAHPHKGITQKEAGIRYDIWRLSGRIFNLRKQGYEIITDNVPNKNGGYHARYRLAVADDVSM